MRPLKEILREMRVKRIYKPIDDETPDPACGIDENGFDRKSCEIGGRCKKWLQAEFAAFAGVTKRTYQRWEEGGNFEPANLAMLLKQLRKRPCKQRSAAKLVDWEEELIKELEFAIEHGPAPRDIRPSIENDLLSQLRAIEKAGLAKEALQQIDLEATIRFIERPEQRKHTSLVSCVSRTITLFEEQLRELECEAENLLKFSSKMNLRSAAQVAISAQEHPPDNNLNFSIDEHLDKAVQAVKELQTAHGDALAPDDQDHLEFALCIFSDAMGKKTDVPFDTISELCGEVLQLAAQKQKPDYFREILEILSGRAARAPATSLFADPAGPEMIVMPLPDYVEIGTSEQEIFIGNLMDPIPKREQPVVRARMNKKFAIGRFPVTVSEYRVFCDEEGHRLPDHNKLEEGAKPVVGVDWHDARKYCSWLSGKKMSDGTPSLHRYRLPSEVEWEFACRTIKYADSPFYFGDYIGIDNAVFEESDLQGVVSTATRRFEPNGYGLFFMHGNVWEWCEDSFEEGYNRNRTQEPIVCAPSVSKVLRGGSWGDPAHMVRSASRLDAPAKTTSDLVGFRVACDL